MVPKKHYDAEEINTALTALAFYQGNARRTSKELKSKFGLDINHSTLGRWKNSTYLDKYRQMVDSLDEKLAAQSSEIAYNLAQIEGKIARNLNDKVDELAARDLPGALRNVSTSRAISIDKSMALRQKPQVVHQHRGGAEELAMKLARLNPELAKAMGLIEEDVVDATIVESKEIEK